MIRDAALRRADSEMCEEDGKPWTAGAQATNGRDVWMSGPSSSCIQSTELRSDMQLTLVLFMLVHSYFFCIVLKLNYDLVIVEPGEKRRAKTKTKTKAHGRPQTTDHRDQTVPKELRQLHGINEHSVRPNARRLRCSTQVLVLVPTMAGWLDRAIHGPPHDSSSSMAHSFPCRIQLRK